MGTPTELQSWGAAHRQLWEKLRTVGRRVEVVAVAWGQHLLDRAERVLQSWTAGDVSEAGQNFSPFAGQSQKPIGTPLNAMAASMPPSRR